MRKFYKTRHATAMILGDKAIQVQFEDGSELVVITQNMKQMSIIFKNRQMLQQTNYSINHEMHVVTAGWRQGPMLEGIDKRLQYLR